MDSKRRVQRYMTDHSREKGTADWLRGEYGDDLPAFPVTVEGAATDLPWPKVQRRIAQLIKEDCFFTEQELDNFEDIDPAAIREQLESGEPSAFVEQVMADVGQLAAEEQSESAPSEPPDLSDQPFTYEGDNTAPEVINAADLPPRDPLAPAYDVGDTVYLEGTAYTITDVNLFDVQLQDPTLAYPILRSEPKERFERLLRQDERNAHLFTQELEQARPAPGPATIYPGDKNGLPVDVIVETLHIDEPEHPQAVAAPTVQNFHITDDHLGEGGLKEKFRRNLEAVTTLHEIEFDKRDAIPAEQEILSRYVGWGALADAFDPKKPDWANEYKELQVVLTPEEYESARASTLNAHYTSPTVIKAIYEAVGNMGFTSGNILEPACGVGNFFGLLPESMAASKLYGTELDSLTGRIAQQLYPQANITVAGFETTNRRDFYDLAVGNVPFGQYKVNDPAYNRLGFTIHNVTIHSR